MTRSSSQEVALLGVVDNARVGVRVPNAHKGLAASMHE